MLFEDLLNQPHAAHLELQLHAPGLHRREQASHISSRHARPGLRNARELLTKPRKHFERSLDKAIRDATAHHDEDKSKGEEPPPQTRLRR